MKDTTVLITIQQDDLTVARVQHVTLKSRRHRCYHCCRRRRCHRHRCCLGIPTRWLLVNLTWHGMAWHGCLVHWWWWCLCCFAHSLARYYNHTRQQMQEHGNGISHGLCLCFSSCVCMCVSLRFYMHSKRQKPPKIREKNAHAQYTTNNNTHSETHETLPSNTKSHIFYHVQISITVWSRWCARSKPL